jgi:hypothetical protein
MKDTQTHLARSGEVRVVSDGPHRVLTTGAMAPARFAAIKRPTVVQVRLVGSRTETGAGQAVLSVSARREGDPR